MVKGNNTVVFYDADGKRWRNFLFSIGLVAISICFVLTFLGIQIVKDTVLVPAVLPVSHNGEVITSVTGSTLKKAGSVNDKYLAITFDDGPDKRNTPQILDVLKEHNVPATFFVVGQNVNREPELVKRIYKEGHDIGNHTYTHANLENAGEFRQKLELNATQKLLASNFGVQTRLFRPPYSDDHNPRTNTQLAPVKTATDMGYLSVGMHVDPKDWKAGSSDEIVKKTITQVKEGRGNIILLYDGGGDRGKTIAALPVIVTQLRQEGYTFVTVSDLFGMESGYVPVSHSLEAQITTSINALGFMLLRFSNKGIIAIAIITAILGIMRFALTSFFAVVEKYAKKKKQYDINYTPTVAAIVPAYNEQTVITKTIDSLLVSDYPHLEVIVVDDGSSDATFETVEEHFRSVKQVKNFRKNNGGKSAAINFGLKETTAEIVVIIDADTIIHHRAVSRLVRHFANPVVGAVAGNAKVGNRVNLLTKLQTIEYITGQNLERRAFSVFNSIRVVAGAIGAWRRDLLINTGGFAYDTLAEDTDMTLRILRMGYRVDYDAEAIAYTEAPQTIASFMKQRFRWMHGTFQAVWKHKDTLFRPSYGMIGIIAVPDVLFFQVIFPLFAPLMDFYLIYNIGYTIYTILDHPTNYSLLALQRALFFYSIFLFFDYASAGLSFVIEKKENYKLLVMVLLQRFVYRQLLYIAAIKSTLAAIKGQEVGWKKLERFASVPHKPRYGYLRHKNHEVGRYEL